MDSRASWLRRGQICCENAGIPLPQNWAAMGKGFHLLGFLSILPLPLFTHGLSPYNTSMGVGRHDCLSSSLSFVPVKNCHHQPLKSPNSNFLGEEYKLHGFILSSLCSSPHDGWAIKETGGPLLVQLNCARKAGSLAQMPVDPLPQHSWHTVYLEGNVTRKNSETSIYILNAKSFGRKWCVYP